MAGLAKLCKMYGDMDITDEKGNTIRWTWDYQNDKPRIKSEMSKEEIAASEKAKWTNLKLTTKPH